MTILYSIMLVSVNLSPIWDYRTIRNMISDRKKLYGKWKWTWERKSLNFLYFNCDYVYALKNYSLARGWYELRDLLGSFNLALIWDSRTLRKMRSDRKMKFTEMEITWRDKYSGLLLFQLQLCIRTQQLCIGLRLVWDSRSAHKIQFSTFLSLQNPQKYEKWQKQWNVWKVRWPGERK